MKLPIMLTLVQNIKDAPLETVTLLLLFLRLLLFFPITAIFPWAMELFVLTLFLSSAQSVLLLIAPSLRKRYAVFLNVFPSCYLLYLLFLNSSDTHAQGSEYCSNECVVRHASFAFSLLFGDSAPPPSASAPASAPAPIAPAAPQTSSSSGTTHHTREHKREKHSAPVLRYIHVPRFCMTFFPLFLIPSSIRVYF